MISIADTSYVLAVTIATDTYHQTCLSVHRQHTKILLPQSTLAEVAYMLGRVQGNILVANFLSGVLRSKYVIVPLTDIDILRTAQLLSQYADSRVDFVDALLVAIAERLSITRILTLDRRDFGILRPRHCDHLDILPQG